MEHGHYLHKVYERYGGFMQFQPLTAEEQLYDDTCRKIDRLEVAIGTKRLALFTAHEFMWFSRHVNKLHIFPKQPQLERQLTDLQTLLASLEAREKR